MKSEQTGHAPETTLASFDEDVAVATELVDRLQRAGANLQELKGWLAGPVRPQDRPDLMSRRADAGKDFAFAHDDLKAFLNGRLDDTAYRANRLRRDEGHPGS
jgi:hypothetical protein